MPDPTGTQAAAAKGVWERLQQHRVLQWTLAYAAAAYTLLHATQMVVESFEWPRLIMRIVTLCLVLAVPIVAVLAWYHGHKARHRVSAAELGMMTALFIIAGSVLWALTRTSQNPAPSAPARSASSPSVVTATGAPPAVPAAPRASIAVVPFVNLTGDTGKEYFSDGMAEELINLLAQVPGLKVPARTSSFAYKGRNIDIRQIARDLGVAMILEGSVRSAGERIRVTAQLVNAQTGYHEWSRDYDRQFTDIFKLQDELAAAIVQALRTNLNVDLPAATIQTAPSQDVEAYRLYLQAQSITNGSEQHFRQSLALYNQALARDPKFARALAARAWLEAAFVNFGWQLPNALENAERDAEQALSLNPQLAEAQTVLGITSALRGNWLKAEASFRAAIAADPSDGAIRATHAVTVFGNVGQLRNWHAEATEAYRLAPGNFLAVSILAAADAWMGRDEDAVKLFDLATEMGASPQPSSEAYTLLALHQRRYADAADATVERSSASIRSAGGAEVIRLAYSALADPEKKPAARQALENLALKLEPRDANYLTATFTMLGALDPAYRVANRALDESMRSGIVGDTWVGLWAPEMRPFRQDPRFQALATRMGFVEYWKQYGPPDDCALEDGKLTCH